MAYGTRTIGNLTVSEAYKTEKSIAKVSRPSMDVARTALIRGYSLSRRQCRLASRQVHRGDEGLIACMFRRPERRP